MYTANVRIGAGADGVVVIESVEVPDMVDVLVSALVPVWTLVHDVRPDAALDTVATLDRDAAPEPVARPERDAAPERVAPPDPVAAPDHVAAPERVAAPDHVAPPDPDAPPDHVAPTVQVPTLLQVGITGYAEKDGCGGAAATCASATDWATADNEDTAPAA